MYPYLEYFHHYDNTNRHEHVALAMPNSMPIITPTIIYTYNRNMRRVLQLH